MERVPEVICLHPAGYPVTDWDIEALKNGFTVLYDLETPESESVIVNLPNLIERFGTNIAVRCGSEKIPHVARKGCTVVVPVCGNEDITQINGIILKECLKPEHVSEASSLGYSGVIIKGSEAGGKTGKLNNFVFLQAALQRTNLPVFVQGGIGRFALAGLFACGAAGAVLNEQLLLFPESPVGSDVRRTILSMSSDETEYVELSDTQFRFHLGTYGSASQKLRDYSDDPSGEIQDFLDTYIHSSVRELGNPEIICPLATDIRFAKSFLDDFGSFKGLARGIKQLYFTVAESLKQHHPFKQGSAFCLRHNIEYPFFQGPMVNITESPEFADIIRHEGGMPFIAVGTLPDRATKKLIKEYRNKSDNPILALGLMGMLGIMDTEGFTRTQTILDYNPDYVLLGGGEPDYALHLEARGIKVYMHTPSPGFLVSCLDKGISRIILEGNEAGGHVAPYSSFILWQEAMYTFEKRSINDMNEISVVFAGGISDTAGVCFLSGMVSLLGNSNINWGIQAGTMLLATEEAVKTGALDQRYQQKILNESETDIVCRRLGRPQRMAPSPKTDKIHTWEQDGIRNKRSSFEMKREFEENVNRGALRLAARDEVFDEESLSDANRPSFIPSGDPDLYQEEAGYLCGQNICLIDNTLTMRDLFNRLFIQSGKALNKLTEMNLNDRALSIPEAGDIAVVGVGGRFPDAQSAEQYWQNILSSKYSVREVPTSRWDPKYYWDPDRKVPNKTYSRIGTFVDLSDFNPIDFGILPNAAADIPDVQKAALLAVLDAFKSSGFLESGYDPEKTGVFMGTSIAAGPISEFAPQTEKDRILGLLKQSETYRTLDGSTGSKLLEEFREIIAGVYRDVNEDTNPGILSNIVSGRIAHSFDLHGPNYTADAACASALAALLNAVRALQSQQVDVAITGGSDISNDALTYITFAKVGALSANMSCPFDIRANGFVMGEGAGVLILKRLKEAQRDGDRIYAVIKGIGSSSDGSARGITAPNREGQRKALERAYIDAGISPSTIGLYEAHGTSTPAGDATEVSNASEYYGGFTSQKDSIPIGSVKSQIGHTKAAAGIAGLIKCVMSLHRHVIPPTLNVKEVNPKLKLAEGPFYISRTPRKWESGLYPRRAVCSSMGFGGTNFHIVLEEYNTGNCVSDDVNINTSGIMFLSDYDDAAIQNLKIEIEKSDTLKPFLRKMFLKEKRPYQRAVPFRNRKELIQSLNSKQMSPAVPEAEPRICFVFPGQGSQFHGMGSHLISLFPELGGITETADRVTRESLGIPISSLVNSVPAGEKGILLKQTLYCQPALVYVSYLCFKTAELLGISPSLCVGHSLGELSALAAGGYLTFEDALRVACARAQAIENCRPEDPGMMAAVFAEEQQIQEILKAVDGYVVIANYNSPEQHVISGNSDAVEHALALFDQEGIRTVILNVSNAFHSELIASASGEFMGYLENIEISKGTVPVLSNLKGIVYPDNDPEAFRRMLGSQLISPVHFTEQVRAAAAEGCDVFLTAGPGGAFSKMIRKILGDDCVCVDLLKDRNTPVYEPVSQLFNAGVLLDERRIMKAMHSWSTTESVLQAFPAQPEPEWFEYDQNNTANTVLSSEKNIPTRANNTIKQGDTMEAEKHETLSDIEQYIVSLNDPVLVNLLHSPGFREFINREKTGIRMIVKQTLLEMFQDYAAEGTTRLPAPELPEFTYESPQISQRVLPSSVKQEEFINLDSIRMPLDKEVQTETESSVSAASSRIDIPQTDNEDLDVKDVLISVIMEKTGYSREMIKDDAEFESDLRIDSIKQTEIIGMLGERLGIPQEAASDIRTERYTVTTVSNAAQQLLEQIS